MMRRITFLLIAMLAISAPAFAGLLNAGLELGLPVGGTHTTLGQITDWNSYDEHGTQTDHSVAYGVAATYTTFSTLTMTAYSGNCAIIKHKGCDATGGYFGIYQTVDTVPGVTYTLTSKINSMSNLTKGQQTYWGYYLFVTNGAGFTRPDTLSAYASGKSDNLSDTGSTVGWVEKSTSFVAASNKTTFAWLTLVNSSSSAGAGQLLGIDSVVLTAVPEPSSILAFGAGLLGLAGFIRRKR